MKNIFLILIIISTLSFGAKVARDKPTHKHASTHESGGSDTVSHDSLTDFVANEHLDWTADQGATNISDTNIPAHTGDVTGTTALALDKTAISGQSLVTTVGTDHFLIEDATDGNLKKALVSDVLGGGTDAAAIHDDTAAEISAITEKTTPVSADLLIIEDSAASNAKKRVQIGNLPVVQGDNFSLDTIQTTDATNTTIRTYSAGTEFGDDDTITVLARCLGRESNGASSIYARHESIFRKDGAATVVEVGNGTQIVEETDDPAYTIDTIVSGSNVITFVHGKVSITINWDCRTQFWVENAV